MNPNEPSENTDNSVPVSTEPTSTPVDVSTSTDSAPSQDASPAPDGAPTNDFSAPQQPAANEVFVADHSQSTGEPTISGAGIDQPGEASVKSGGPKKKMMAVLLAIALVVVLAGGYTFAFYIPNQPSNVFKSGVKNTGSAEDSLINYFKTQDTSSYKSASVNGSLDVTSNGLDFNVALDGSASSKGATDLNLKTAFAGNNISGSLRTIPVTSSTVPDIYFQVSGVKSILDSDGLNQFDSLDGQWIKIDHSSLTSLVNNPVLQSAKATAAPLTVADINDAMSKIQTVNKQYLFSTSSTGVLVNQKYLGKQTLNGRSNDHYQVGYSKTNLEAYVSALASALNSSKLDSWSQSTFQHDLVPNSVVTSTDNSIKSSNGNYSFNLWVDTKTKLISSIEFTDTSSSKNTLTFSQGYTGGSLYPLTIAFSGGSQGSFTAGLSIDTSSNTYTLKVDGQSSGTKVSANFTLKPGSGDVNVSAPAGAIPIEQVLGGLSQGGATSALGL